MRLLAEYWRHEPKPTPAYAALAFERDQGIAQAAKDAAHAHTQLLLEELGIRAPAAPILRVDGAYVETDCTESDHLATVEMPSDEPDRDGFIEGFDDYPETLNDMRDGR